MNPSGMRGLASMGLVMALAAGSAAARLAELERRGPLTDQEYADAVNRMEEREDKVTRITVPPTTSARDREVDRQVQVAQREAWEKKMERRHRKDKGGSLLDKARRAKARL